MILNLILYNDNHIYRNMKDVLQKYLITQNIEFFFYCFKPDIEEDYILEENMLYIKGKETFLPGILDKTIKAIEITKDFKYDYLIRSNISTIVNFDLLYKYLEMNRVNYGGSCILNLNWLDSSCGIYDTTHWETYYVRGNAIVLSREMVDLLIRNKHQINYEVIDDIAIGLFYKNYMEKSDIVYFEEVVNSTKPVDNAIFYRNKNQHRLHDVKNMWYIVSCLIKKKDKIK